MVKAVWEGAVLAESDRYESMEGNIYFPLDSIDKQYFRGSDTEYECPWKGHAGYYDIVVGGNINKDAAWYYLSPKPAAKRIEGYVAFDERKVIKIGK